MKKLSKNICVSLSNKNILLFIKPQMRSRTHHNILLLPMANGDRTNRNRGSERMPSSRQMKDDRMR